MGTIFFRVNPSCVNCYVPWVLSTLGSPLRALGVNHPGTFPWETPGRFPVRIIREPVAGATPLEGPGASGASLPPEPWDGGFPPGV